jgi:multidrug transporter EmrE-like cation transporter
MVLDPVSLALAVYAVIALVCFGLALQRGSVTTAAAITFTVETVVPAAVGLVWLGDRIRPGLAGLAAAGFLLTLGGCVALARYAGEPD